MHRVLAMLLFVCCSGASAAIINGDFETDDLTGWTSAIAPDAGIYAPPSPLVNSGAIGSGINGLGGANDAYAVLDSTLSAGNPSGINVYASISQQVFLGGQTGWLEFRLTDLGDEPPPVISNNHAGMLLDNIRIWNNAGTETLSFNWYALAKTDQSRNDRFDVLFNGQTLHTFFYNDPIIPTQDANGGGGNIFGPFSYGTGWQGTDIPVQPIPEPGSLAMLAFGGAFLVRRRKRA